MKNEKSDTLKSRIFLLSADNKASWKSNSRTLLCLVPLHTGGRSQRRQYRRRHRCDDLHNPLKSLFLRHNRLMVLMVNVFVR